VYESLLIHISLHDIIKYNKANPKGGGRLQKYKSNMVNQLTTKHYGVNLLSLMIYDLETITPEIPSFLYLKIVYTRINFCTLQVLSFEFGLLLAQ